MVDGCVSESCVAQSTRPLIDTLIGDIVNQTYSEMQLKPGLR